MTSRHELFYVKSNLIKVIFHRSGSQAFYTKSILGLNCKTYQLNRWSNFTIFYLIFSSHNNFCNKNWQIDQITQRFVKGFPIERISAMHNPAWVMAFRSNILRIGIATKNKNFLCYKKKKFTPKNHHIRVSRTICILVTIFFTSIFSFNSGIKTLTK